MQFQQIYLKMIPVPIGGIPFQMGVKFINLGPKTKTNTKCTLVVFNQMYPNTHLYQNFHQTASCFPDKVSGIHKNQAPEKNWGHLKMTASASEWYLNYLYF